MHEESSDERAHSHTYRFFPSAMHLDKIGSIGHRTFDCSPVCANFSMILQRWRSHLDERADPTCPGNLDNRRAVTPCLLGLIYDVIPIYLPLLLLLA
jgi:hypothetical protein